MLRLKDNIQNPEYDEKYSDSIPTIDIKAIDDTDIENFRYNNETYNILDSIEQVNKKIHGHVTNHIMKHRDSLKQEITYE